MRPGVQVLSTAATTHSGPSPFGPFALLAKLARGDLADLFLARRRGAGGFEKLVVIKRIHPQLTKDPELVELFLGEARVAAHIDHPNVRRVYELGEVQGHFYIAVEYLEGVPLMELLLARTRAPGLANHRVLTALVAQACEGLYAAHAHADSRQRPVVHGDLNPRSLFVTSSGYAKILDFDIVEMRGALAERHGFVQRTCAYMAPEQVRGGAIDARTDIFSLGVVAWEAVTGRRLFKQKTRELTIAAVDHGVVPRPSEFNPAVSPRLDDAILQALERDPALRYATAREFGTALDKAALDEGPPVTPLAVEALVLQAFGPELEAQRRFVRRARTDRETPLPGQAEAEAAANIDEAETRIAERPAMDEAEDGHTVPDADFELHFETDDAAPEPLAWQESASFVLSGAVLALGDADEDDGAGVVTLEHLAAPEAFADDDSGVIVGGAAAAKGALAARRPIAAAPAARRSVSFKTILLAAAVGFAAVSLYGLVTGKDRADESAASEVPAPVAAGDSAADVAPAEAILEAAQGQGGEAERKAQTGAPGRGDGAQRDAAEREREQKQRRAAERRKAAEREREQKQRRAAEREREQKQRRAAERKRERRRAAEAERAAASTPARPGVLTVDATPYATVLVDGVERGVTPLVKLELSPGVHQVELRSSAGGDTRRFRIEIEPGKVVRRKVSW